MTTIKTAAVATVAALTMLSPATVATSPAVAGGGASPQWVCAWFPFLCATR